jgi:ubiquinone/menaquinone biosynthesis C-methylase UbiE
VESAADQREEMLERWEAGAAGWSRRADSIQEFGMRVSVWMVEQLGLQAGQRVLDLACGPGDTGFLAAELVKPGGTLVASDASRSMLGVATGRARDLGVTNVEFKQLELEWIDLPTASVDGALCRWGLMFTVDPGAALQEIRRVLRPGGRLAAAVWDRPEENPWATLPTRALVELGHIEPPDPTAPGMFALADPQRLRDLLETAGFTEVIVERIELVRADVSVSAYLEETLDLSRPVAEVWEGLSELQRRQLRERLDELARPYLTPEGAVRFPARSLVAAGGA